MFINISTTHESLYFVYSLIEILSEKFLNNIKLFSLKIM